VRRGLEVQLDGVRQQADHLSLTNPHAVVLVDSVEGIPLAAWAAEVEVQGRFQEGVNVEFVERRPLPGGGLRARVYERGVGETGSCGTGACAVANVARERLCASLPLEVHFPGGVLRVGETEHGEAWVEGPVWMAKRAETDENTREDGAAEERSAAVESTDEERGRAAEWAT
jgi:diaminopimelate epimerase